MVEVYAEEQNLVSILHICGAFNIETLNEIESVWNEQFSKDPKIIAIDCTKLEQIDSTAIGALVRYLNLCNKKNIELVFYSLSSTIMELFETSKLNKFFTICSQKDFKNKFKEYLL